MKKTNNEYTKTLTSSIENAKEFYAARTEYTKTINDIIAGSKVVIDDKNKYILKMVQKDADSIDILFEQDNAEETLIDDIIDMFYKYTTSNSGFYYNFIDNFLDFLTSFAAPYLYSEFVNRNICSLITYKIPTITIENEKSLNNRLKTQSSTYVPFQIPPQFGYGSFPAQQSPGYGIPSYLQTPSLDGFRQKQLTDNGVFKTPWLY